MRSHTCFWVVVPLVLLLSLTHVEATWYDAVAAPFLRNPISIPDVGPCVNGGTWDGTTCTCPVYYTGDTCAQRQCPNSVGGAGAYHILPVNPDTMLCDSCDTKNYDGLNCQMCQRDESCRAYGSDVRCDRGIVVKGNNKHFQCGLQNEFFLNLMGDGKRNITADIVLDCATEDGEVFGAKENGQCSMAIYRMEPDNEYVDPFFRCRASRCSMVLEDKEKEHSADEPDKETKREHIFRVVRVGGQITLVVLCTLLTLLGTCSKQLGFRRMKYATATLALLIVLVVTSYIILTALSMQTAPLEQTVVYECRETRCACAEDAPRRYEPICSESAILNNTILPAVRNSIRIRCGTADGACTLTLTDLTLMFDAQCRASECVNEDEFPDGPPPDPSVVKHQRYMTALFVLLVLVCGGVVVHWYYARARSKQRAKDFLILFNVPAVSGRPDESGAAAEDGPGNDEIDAADEEGPLLGNGSSPQSAVSIRESVYRRAAALSPEEQSEVQRVRDLNSSPLDLSVSGLHYTLIGPCLASREEAAPRMILDNINFSIRSGEVLAIMGPSGAGKTSLLDLLSARTKAGQANGEIALNGTPISISRHTSAQYRNLIGYVSQEDTLLPALTVRQTIEYAARLKLPQAFSHSTIDRIVTQVIERMRLQLCANTLVGNGSGIRGISGGERRRVSIAVELLANPRILFLDEPTSGLDAVSARHVTEAVVELAKDSPMRSYAPYYFSFRPIVIFSIHQPSTEIYNLFDQILLLSHGVSVYGGPARGAAATLEARVKTALGPTRRVPSHTEDPNPAEYLMRLEEYLDDGARTELQQEDIACNRDRRTQREAVAYLSATTQDMTTPTREQQQQEQHSASSGRAVAGSAHVTFSSAPAQVDGASIMETSSGFRIYYANVYQQLAILTSRATSCLIGSFHLVVCHAAVVACMASLMSFLYKEQELDLPGALNRAGSSSFLLLVTAFVSLSCLEQLIVERKLFIVERENGFYVTFSYLMSKVLVDIVPLRVIPSVVLSSIIYYPMGFRTDSGTHFYWFILIIVLFSVCQTLIVFCIGIIAGSFGSAALISSVIILWNFVFGGALVQAQTIPAALKPFQSISPFFLAFESLLVNELDGQACVFSPTDETGKESAARIPIMCVQYLANIGLQPERFASDVMQLTLFCFLFLILAWVLLGTCTKLIR